MGEIPKDELERLALAESGSCEDAGHQCNYCGGCWCRQWAGICECPREPETGLRYIRVAREAQNLTEKDVILDPEDGSETLEIVDVVVERGYRYFSLCGVYLHVHDKYGDSHALELPLNKMVDTLEVPRELV